MSFRASKATLNSLDASGHARNKSSLKLRPKLGMSSSVKTLPPSAGISSGIPSPGHNQGSSPNTLATFADYYVKSPDHSKTSKSHNTRGRLSIFSPEKARKTAIESLKFANASKGKLIAALDSTASLEYANSPMYIDDGNNIKFYDSQGGESISKRGLSAEGRHFNFFGNSRFEDLDMESSGYQRTNKSTEHELSRYIRRAQAVSRAESRRVQTGSQDRGRRELIKTGKEYARTIEGLSADEQDRLRKLEEEDDNYFKQMETIFVNGINRIEKIEKQGKDPELHEGAWVDLDSEIGAWRYCFVYVRGKTTPLTVSVKTKKETKSLKILVSKSLVRPNKGVPDYDFTDKKSFKLIGKNKAQETFENSYFYFAFCSRDCGGISINVTFGIVEAEKQSVHVRKNRALTLKMTRAEEDNLDQDVAEIKKYFKDKQLRLSNGVNLIELNKRVDRFTPLKIAEQRESRKIKLHELMKTALTNKSHIMEQKKEKIIAQQMLRETQKVLKAAFIADNMHKARQKAKRAERQKPWLVMLAMFKVVSEVFERFKAEIKKEKLKKAVMAANFASRMRREQDEKGADTDQRAILDIRMALTLNAFVCRDRQQEQAGLMLRSVFQDVKTVKNIQNKCTLYIETIKKVQGAWRHHQRVRDGFKDLLKKLWDKNFERVFLGISQKGDNNQNMVKAINMKAFLKQITWQELKNNEDARDKFVDTHMRICADRYIKNYDTYNANVNRTEKRKFSLLELIKSNSNPNNKNRERRRSNRSISNKSRMSIMEEIEHNSQVGNESEPTSTVFNPGPPKFFLLPSAEELDELLEKIINAQIATAFRRISSKVV